MFLICAMALFTHSLASNAIGGTNKVAKKIPSRKLGSQGCQCGIQGLGTMTMTAFYDSKFSRIETEEDSIKAIGKALELGVNMLDTAFIYQSFGIDGNPNTTNEELVGKALKRYGRKNFVVATKTGIVPGGGITGDPKIIEKQLEESLKRLDTDYIDLYYLHRIDPKTPIKETIGYLAKKVKEGKIKYIGLSECTPKELRDAHAIHPITAVQMEWSVQTRDIENDIVPLCRELGVGIVAYSPLGRGFLSQTFTKRDDLDEKDWRLTNGPRYNSENFDKNIAALKQYFEIAKKMNVTPAQLALAWLHNQGEDVFPIPGTKSARRVEENSAGAIIHLTRQQLDEISACVSVVGNRYSETGMAAAYNSRL